MEIAAAADAAAAAAAAAGAAMYGAVAWMGSARRRRTTSGLATGDKGATADRGETAEATAAAWGGHAVEQIAEQQGAWRCTACGRRWDAVAVKHGVPRKMPCHRQAAAVESRGPTQSTLF